MKLPEPGELCWVLGTYLGHGDGPDRAAIQVGHGYNAIQTHVASNEVRPFNEGKPDMRPDEPTNEMLLAEAWWLHRESQRLAAAMRANGVELDELRKGMNRTERQTLEARIVKEREASHAKG